MAVKDTKDVIIKHRTDDDLYKLSMAQFFLHQFPGSYAKYRFKCRNKGVNLLKYREEIEEQIDHLCRLHYTSAELKYISNLRFIKPDFVEFLRLFTFNRDFIHFGELDGQLDVWVEGPLVNASLFEIPDLRITHEVYSDDVYPPDYAKEGIRRLEQKITLIKEYADRVGLPPKQALPVVDFGGRRCAFGNWHMIVVETLNEAGVLVGTSNVYLALNEGIPVIGTMAHEAFQAGQAMGVRLMDSQKLILQKWAEEYRGDLGIALTDTLGIDKFLLDFDLYFAKLFDGVRHDSGDPFVWGEKIIAHYEKMRIDPMNKTAVFSDGLDIPRAIEIMDRFRGRIKVSFGIGTNLTNDVGPKPLQNVFKMVECNGQPVAKISDDPSKSMCEDPAYQAELMRLIHKEIAVVA